MKKLSVKEIFEQKIKITQEVEIILYHAPIEFFEEYDAKLHENLRKLYYSILSKVDESFNEIGGYIRDFHEYGQLSDEDNDDLNRQYSEAYKKCIDELEKRITKLSDEYNIKPVRYRREY